MADTQFYINNGPFTLQRIEEICEAQLADKSKAQTEVKEVASMLKAGADEICFFYDKKAKEKAAEIRATACVTTAELEAFVPAGVIKLIAANPKVAFLKLMQAMYAEKTPRGNIASTAKIHPSAIICEDTFVGEYAVIGEKVRIGSHCQIEAGVVIADGCQIGDNCRIGANASIAYTIMGNDCYVYTGARIGQDGFGFQVINGKHQRIPQVGRVIIGNDVEIGANACVDRGALDDTVIGDGCRIDNLVQVAHNDKLGKGCVVVAQTGIAGSCTFGDYVVCGGQTGFADHLTIGSGAQIGAQSGLIKDVEPGAIMMGYPAIPIKRFYASSCNFAENA